MALFNKIENLVIYNRIRNTTTSYVRSRKGHVISVTKLFNKISTLDEFQQVQTKSLTYLFKKIGTTTSQFGLPFLIKDLRAANKSMVRELMDQLARSFIECLPILKKDFTTTWTCFVPLISQVDSQLVECTKTIHQELTKSDCCLTENGKWTFPKRVLCSENSNLLSAADCQDFFQKEKLNSKVTMPNELLEALQISQFSLNDLVSLFKNEKWIIDHSDDWFFDLYRYLGSKMFQIDDAFFDQCKNLKLIRTADGATLSGKNVFFHCGAIPDYFNFIKYVPRILEDDNVSLLFLQKVGVCYFSPSKLVEACILPNYGSNTFESLDTHIEHALFIRDNLAVLQSEMLEQLKILFPLLNEGGKLKTPSSIYFAKVYLSNGPFLQDLLSQVDFVSSKYLEYSQTMQDTFEIGYHIRRWKDLFTFLNVSHFPKINQSEEVLNSVQSKQKRYGWNGAKIIDFKPTQDIIKMMNTDPYETIRFMDSNWNYYQHVMEKRIVTGDYRLKNLGYQTLIEPSGFLRYLQDFVLPTSSEKTHIYGTLYGPNIKLYGRIYPFYLGEIKNESFKTLLGIRDDFNPSMILDSLERLKLDTNLTDEDKAIQFLSIIDILSKMKLEFEEEILEDFLDTNTRQVICQIPKKVTKDLRTYFASETLLFVGFEWYKSSQLFWTQDQILFGDSEIPSLDSFPEFRIYKRFFRSLGVQDVKPVTDILQEIEQNESNPQLIFKVYVKLNDWIEMNQNHGWIHKALSTSALLYTSKGMMTIGTGRIFLNDDDELLDKFADVVIVFDPPKDLYGKLVHFLDCCHISPLSSATKITITNQMMLRDKVQEERFRFNLKCIETFLYYYHFSELEKLKRRKFTSRNFELKKTKDKIHVTYELGKYRFNADCGAKYDRLTNTLYISESNNGIKEITDEVSRIFDSFLNKDFKLFLYTLISSEDPEEFMEIVGLPFPSRDLVEAAPSDKIRMETTSPVELRRIQDMKTEQMLHMVDEIVEQTLEEPREIWSGPPKPPKRKLFEEIEVEPPPFVFDHYMPRNTPYYEQENFLSPQQMKNGVVKDEKLDPTVLGMVLRTEAKRLAQWGGSIEVYDADRHSIQENAFVFDLHDEEKVESALKYNPMLKFIREEMGEWGYDLNKLGFTILCVHPQTFNIDRLILLKNSNAKEDRVIGISAEEFECCKLFRDLFYLYYVENQENKPTLLIQRDPYRLEHVKLDGIVALNLKSSSSIQELAMRTSPRENTSRQVDTSVRRRGFGKK